MNDEVTVQECGQADSPLGKVLELRILREDGNPMSWNQVWEAFNAEYPECWAFELFPPTNRLYNHANVYHLFLVLNDDLTGSVLDLS